MSRDKAVRAAQVQANADAIITELKAGRDCAFATLGDAMTYSTFGYVLEIIREAIPGVELEIVPGITSRPTVAAKRWWNASGARKMWRSCTANIWQWRGRPS